MSMLIKIVRNFRQYLNSPAKFLAFCKKVEHALSNFPNLPPSVLALLTQFSEKLGVLDPLYHQSLDRAKSIIRERDKVMQELVALLDQMASTLEAEFILNPEALRATGFDVTQERRSPPRPRIPLTASDDFTVVHVGGRKALGKASTVPGALIQEIHLNLKDPSVEANWFHKAIFFNTKEMLIEDLEPGNIFVRMRHLGHDGAGPWSAVVTITI